MRLLGLDWGTVRIGVAISDPDGKIAFPLDRPVDAKGAAEEIKKICLEQQVEKIIMGNPKTLEGIEGASSEKVATFKKELLDTIGLPIELLDERLTSVEAGKILTTQGLNTKKQKEILDNIAAQLMLQQYINNKHN